MEGNLEAVIAAARKGIEPVALHSTDTRTLFFAPVGDGGEGQFREHNTEAGLLKPVRKRGHVKVFDAASFNMVLADNADAGNIAIYIDRNVEKPSVVAVMN